MTDIARIDDEVIDSDEFVKLLKLGDRFNALIEDIIKDKLAVHAARKQGIEIADEELQERADQLRRAKGLHRAKDTNRFLDVLGVTLDDFERYISDMLYKEKLMECCAATRPWKSTFNSTPRSSTASRSATSSSIPKARPRRSCICSKRSRKLLADRPGTLTADTKRQRRRHWQGAARGAANRRGSQGLQRARGDAARSVSVGGRPLLRAVHRQRQGSATLDEQTRSEIRRLIYDGWLGSRARDHRLEAL